MKEQQYVSLENLGHGAAAEMFQNELSRVIANISDPNTKPDEARGLTLKLTIKPSKDRTLCAVSIACVPKLAPVQAFETQMFIGMDKGKGVASEYNPAQGNLTVKNDDGEEVDVVTGQVLRMVAGVSR